MPTPAGSQMTAATGPANWSAKPIFAAAQYTAARPRAASCRRRLGADGHPSARSRGVASLAPRRARTDDAIPGMAGASQLEGALATPRLHAVLFPELPQERGGQ